MRRTKLQRTVLAVMASSPATHPYPLYCTARGGKLLRPDMTWLTLTPRKANRLAQAGLISAVQADGQPARVALWHITDAGRAAIAAAAEEGAPTA